MHSNTEVVSTLELETGSRFTKLDMILESVMDPNAETGDALVLTIEIEDKPTKVYATFRLSEDELFKLRDWLNDYVSNAEPVDNGTTAPLSEEEMAELTPQQKEIDGLIELFTNGMITKQEYQSRVKEAIETYPH